MKCKNCSVEVAKGQGKCPLCNKIIQEQDNSLLDYPKYNGIDIEVNKHMLRKILLFMSIVAGVVSIFINIFTYEEHSVLWSVLVVVALVVAWRCVRLIKSKKINIGGKAVHIFLAIALLVVTIDWCCGFLKWSTTYVIPFMSIALTLVITMITTTKKNRYNEYFGYLLTTFLVSLIPLALIIFPLSNSIWTSLVSIIFSLLTTVGLIIFSDKSFKTEIKKRFHI